MATTKPRTRRSRAKPKVEAETPAVSDPSATASSAPDQPPAGTTGAKGSNDLKPISEGITNEAGRISTEFQSDVTVKKGDSLTRTMGVKNPDRGADLASHAEPISKKVACPACGGSLHVPPLANGTIRRCTRCDYVEADRGAVPVETGLVGGPDPGVPADEAELKAPKGAAKGEVFRRTLGDRQTVVSEHTGRRGLVDDKGHVTLTHDEEGQPV